MKMSNNDFDFYWQCIPTDKEAPTNYAQLKTAWGMNERQVRSVLHELGKQDNGDAFVLIRSGSRKGFYKTDDLEAIAAYRRECLNKGRSIMAAVNKCNRLLKNKGQCSLFDDIAQ